MIDEFLIEYDRILSQVSQSYNDNEILSFLNRSQEILIGELYKARRFDLLGSLYTIADNVSPIQMTSSGISNGYYVLRSDTGSFSRGVMYFLDVVVSATRTSLPAGSETSMAEWIDKDYSKRFIKSLSNSCILFRTPKVYTEGDYLIILVDSFTGAPTVSIQYIKYPLTLVASSPVSNVSTTTCEMRADLHKDIVTKAVYLAKEATDRLQQTKQKEE